MRQDDMQILRKVEPLWDDYESIEDFEFLCSDDFENIVLPFLRENTRPYPERRLSRKILRSRGVVYEDGSTTLDGYYVAMINDTLSAIRSGERAYIFNLEQVIEILRFEPTTNFVLYDGIYYATLCV